MFLRLKPCSLANPAGDRRPRRPLLPAAAIVVAFLTLERRTILKLTLFH
jgi:hypothetical protein